MPCMHALHVCLPYMSARLCLPYMHAYAYAYVCAGGRGYAYVCAGGRGVQALHLCRMRMPYPSALYVCLICMPYRRPRSSSSPSSMSHVPRRPTRLRLPAPRARRTVAWCRLLSLISRKVAYMYALHVCLLCMPSMYALYVALYCCLMSLPCMAPTMVHTTAFDQPQGRLYVCLICLPYMSPYMYALYACL